MPNTAGALRLYRDQVRPDWVDYNRHLNIAFYVRAFDLATDAFFEHIGIDHDYVDREGHSYYVLETHVSFHREMKEAAPMRFETALLDLDAKRVHLFHWMYHAEQDYLAATNELLYAHVNQHAARTAPFPPAVQSHLREIHAAHRKLPRHPDVGRVIGIRR